MKKLFFSLLITCLTTFIFSSTTFAAEHINMNYDQVGDIYYGNGTGMYNNYLSTSYQPTINIGNGDIISTYIYFKNNDSYRNWTYRYSVGIDPSYLSFDITYQGHCSHPVRDIDVKTESDGDVLYTFKFGQPSGNTETINPGECADGYVQWIYKQGSNNTYIWSDDSHLVYGEILFNAGIRLDNDTEFYSDDAVIIN